MIRQGIISSGPFVSRIYFFATLNFGTTRTCYVFEILGQPTHKFAFKLIFGLYLSPILENRSIELHSPDGIHSCILRATDPAEAMVWFNALHSAIAQTTQAALVEANRVLVSLIGELRQIGWLSRRISGGGGGSGGSSSGCDGRGASSDSSTEDTERWQPVFVAVTDRELRYDGRKKRERERSYTEIG